MTVLKINSLKHYKDKLETYISDLTKTVTESEVINVFSGPHKYRFEISPSASDEGYYLLCRLNVEQNKKRLTFENIDYSNRKASKAIINTQQGVCNVSISNPGVFSETSKYDYSVAYPLRGDGQCLSWNGGTTYIFTLDKIANLSSISFFPSWNRYGTRGNDFITAFGDRYSKSVNVKVYCDDEEIFNGELSGLVPNDRVYVTFDGHNRCHLEKINVGSAEAFANY